MKPAFSFSNISFNLNMLFMVISKCIFKLIVQSNVSINSYPSLVVDFFYISFLMKKFILAFKNHRLERDTDDSYKLKRYCLMKLPTTFHEVSRRAGENSAGDLAVQLFSPSSLVTASCLHSFLRLQLRAPFPKAQCFL